MTAKERRAAMSKEINRLVYGLTDLQRTWSTAKLRRIVNDKGYHVKARAHFYAELLRRKLARETPPEGR